MPDYKEMYLKMMRASERAVRILIETQQECEAMYLEAPEGTLTPLPEQRDEPVQNWKGEWN